MHFCFQHIILFIFLSCTIVVIMKDPFHDASDTRIER